MISYPNALDEDGNLTKIASVNKDNKATHYFCLGCGKEMTPVLGTYKAKHFRHLVEGDCNPETYLHEYCKRTLAGIFNSAKEFPVTYNLTKACPRVSSCPLQSSITGNQCNGNNCKSTIDLKKDYDMAVIEGICDGFRADILLVNSRDTSVRPLFLEIKVTHPCSEDKKQSNNRIIEIEVQKEDDIERPIVECDEENFTKVKHQIDHQPYIKFFNFDRTVSNLIDIHRFYVLQNGESGFEDECIKCSSFFTHHHPGSIFEIGVKDTNYNTVLAQTYSHGLVIRHCSFCSNYGWCMIGIPGMVFNPKTKKKEPGIRKLPAHTLKDDEFDKHQQAMNCPSWHADSTRIKKVAKSFPSNEMLIWNSPCE